MFRKAILCAAILLAGCSTQKELQIVGGSKSDGTLKLAYEANIFESPVINYEQAKNKAIQRCSAWGYGSAESFDNGFRECVMYNANGTFLRRQVTVTYQCVD